MLEAQYESRGALIVDDFDPVRRALGLLALVAPHRKPAPPDGDELGHPQNLGTDGRVQPNGGEA